MDLESRIQDALRQHAPRGRDTEQIGSFLATFTRGTDNPYLNYAIPDEGGSASPEDVEALVNAYRARDRKPRLEYIPSVAPTVEAELIRAGFEIEGRLPLMTCQAPQFEPPAGVELVSPSTENEFRGVAEVQWEAYGETEPMPDSAVAGLRRTADTGGVVVLARSVETGEAAGAGLCVAPHDGVTELAAIGVREKFRRRGIAAAMAGWLTRAAHDKGMTLVFLMAHGSDEARIYRRAGFVDRGEVLHISFSAERSRS
ncbi:MAG: GNAT family N-acetyltransferase [Actinobacteria bacterium]|nr:GNAT family N-acetyltransferase [Actinomycetota bacterium]